MPSSSPLAFGEFTLDVKNAILRRGTASVRLRPQALRILGMLAERPGELVEREQIRAAVWGTDTFVDFNQGLNVCIRQIREALDDDPEAPRFIETVPRLGYRFIAPVTAAGSLGTEAVVNPGALPESAPDDRASVHPSTDSGQQPSAAPPDPAGPAATHGHGRTARAWRWVAAAAIVTLTAAGVWVWRGGEAAPAESIESVAVLPLVNLTGDPAQDYLVDGLTEAVRTDLSRIKAFAVIAPGSAAKYRARQKPVQDIARELGVDAVVDGSVQRSGERIRIHVQVIGARSNRSLWADTYERSTNNLFAAQEEVAQSIAVAVRGALTPEQRTQLTRHRPRSEAAYEAYLKGRHFWARRSTEGLDTAIKYFTEAITLDPQYARAYAGLADCYGLGANVRMSLPQMMETARTAARRALELDGTLAEAETSLAMVEMFYDWDFGEAEQRLARAVLLDPSYAPAHQLQAELYAVTGRFDASVAALGRARRLDPLSLSIGRDIGRLAYYRRDFPAAAAALRRTLELDETFTPARFVLAFSLSLAGDHKAALPEFERMDRSPMRGLMRAAHAYELAQVGRREEAIRLVRELEEATRDTSSLVRSYDVALAHVGLGDVEATLSWLEEARAQRSYRIVYLGVDPVFDPLRGHRRFTTLLSSLGLGVLAGPLATSAQSVPPAALGAR